MAAENVKLVSSIAVMPPSQSWLDRSHNFPCLVSF